MKSEYRTKMSEKDLKNPVQTVQTTNGVMENNIDGIHVSKRYFSLKHSILFIVILFKITTKISNLNASMIILMSLMNFVFLNFLVQRREINIKNITETPNLQVNLY